MDEDRLRRLHRLRENEVDLQLVLNDLVNEVESRGAQIRSVLAQLYKIRAEIRELELAGDGPEAA